MKRTLSLGNDYANSIGVVIDTMAAIDFDRKKGTEIVGSVIVSQSGIGTYFAPRQSKYKLVFRGKSPVFDEVGDSHNWYQRKEYVMPVSILVVLDGWVKEQWLCICLTDSKITRNLRRRDLG